MLLEQYESQKIAQIIEYFIENESTGELHLKTHVTSWKHQKTFVLIFNRGQLTFGDIKVPTIKEFDPILKKISKSDLFDSALKVAKTRVKNYNSVRELITSLVKLQVLTWKEVEGWVAKKIICNLELFWHHPGEAKWQENNTFDLLYGEDAHGLNWSKLEQKMLQRQKQWSSLASIIPKLDIIPIVNLTQIQHIENIQIKQHLNDLVDGRNTLLDIANSIQKDPLTIAKTYGEWFNNGWIRFADTPEIQKDLSIILSLDDSPIVQTTIKRALQAKYQVLLSNNAEEALKILKKYPVQLLLLDLTLPDMDGLEFCRQIRKIPKLNDLPVIMVTGRDGLVDRAKGRFAGTNSYLTKPFKAEELNKIVAQYVV